MKGTKSKITSSFPSNEITKVVRSNTNLDTELTKNGLRETGDLIKWAVV